MSPLLSCFLTLSNCLLILFCSYLWTLICPPVHSHQPLFPVCRCGCHIPVSCHHHWVIGCITHDRRLAVVWAEASSACFCFMIESSLPFHALPFKKQWKCRERRGEVKKEEQKIEKVWDRRFRSSACCECLESYFISPWIEKRKSTDCVWMDLNNIALYREVKV